MRLSPSLPVNRSQTLPAGRLELSCEPICVPPRPNRFFRPSSITPLPRLFAATGLGGTLPCMKCFLLTLVGVQAITCMRAAAGDAPSIDDLIAKALQGDVPAQLSGGMMSLTSVSHEDWDASTPPLCLSAPEPSRFIPQGDSAVARGMRDGRMPGERAAGLITGEAFS